MICISRWNINLFYMCILFSFILINHSNAEENKNTIVISGIITNIEKAQKYIGKDSYLQLVYVPPDGIVISKTDNQGRVVYESDLSKIDIPSNGVFTLETKDLKPGKYVISAQALMPAGIGGKPFLGIKETKKIAIIDMPEEAEKPIKVQFGELFIAVP